MNEDEVYGRIFKILIGMVDEAEPDDEECFVVQAWANSTLDLLEMVYPHDIFTGHSGDPGPRVKLEIIKQLNAYLKRGEYE